MGRTTSISLGDNLENFVDKQLSSGRYKNASEVIRAGLRLLEEQDNKIHALQKAIVEGTDSGQVKNFNPKNHLSGIKAAKRKTG
jgi:antitoxin ParD1/3/4